MPRTGNEVIASSNAHNRLEGGILTPDLASACASASHNPDRSYVDMMNRSSTGMAYAT